MHKDPDLPFGILHLEWVGHHHPSAFLQPGNHSTQGGWRGAQVECVRRDGLPTDGRSSGFGWAAHLADDDRTSGIVDLVYIEQTHNHGRTERHKRFDLVGGQLQHLRDRVNHHPAIAGA